MQMDEENKVQIPDWVRDVLPVAESNFSRNAKIKTYRDGSWELLICSEPIFNRSGYELHERYPRHYVSDLSDTKKSAAAVDVERAMRRAASKVRDLALSNEFKYFVTLTLDRTRIDRYDINAVMKRVNVWLDNQVRRKGLRYILVPERHKDGAIHFHGFFSDALECTPSGVHDGKGHMMYNINAWPYGFTTALELYDDYHAAVSYVCKYVRKQQEKIGGRWYYSGGKLEKPRVDYADMEFTTMDGAYTFCVPGKSFVLLRGGREEVKLKK